MKVLSTSDYAMWLRAGEAFSAEHLSSEIQEIIKWAPALNRNGENYLIARKELTDNVWEAICEIEDWGMAERIDNSGYEYLKVDASLLDLIMTTIKLLLKILSKPEGYTTPIKRPLITFDDSPSLS